MNKTAQNFVYHFHAWRRSWSNYSLLKYRRCDGLIASMHQAGTHWLKFMLASALARHYGIPAPEYNHANDIIGGTKDRVVYAHIPHIISAHSIPPAICKFSHFHRCVQLPAYVVLVRDIRASLVSNYEKWKTKYDNSFSEYLRGDPSGRRFNSDIWWCLRFLNAWSGLKKTVPDKVLVVRYEDLQADPAIALTRIVKHFNLSLEKAELEYAVEVSTKAAMAGQDDPERPAGAVRFDDRDPLSWFQGEDIDYFRDLVSRYLVTDYGYKY